MHLKMISTTLPSGSSVAGARVLVERRAGHVLHHQVAAVGLDHRVVDVDDVRVVQLAGERGLGDERLVHHALGLGVDAGRELQHLDRDVAVGERVAREVHAAGGAAADLADHRVLADRLLPLDLFPPHAAAYLATSCSSSASG